MCSLCTSNALANTAVNSSQLVINCLWLWAYMQYKVNVIQVPCSTFFTSSGNLLEINFKIYFLNSTLFSLIFMLLLWTTSICIAHETCSHILFLPHWIVVYLFWSFIEDSSVNGKEPGTCWTNYQQPSYTFDDEDVPVLVRKRYY